LATRLDVVSTWSDAGAKVLSERLRALAACGIAQVWHCGRC